LPKEIRWKIAKPKNGKPTPRQRVLLKRHSETEVRKTILAETTSTYLTGVALRTVIS